MDALVYNIPDVLTFSLGTNQSVRAKLSDYTSRFDGRDVKYRVSNDGTIALNKDAPKGASAKCECVLAPRQISAKEPLDAKPVVFEQLTYFFDIDFAHDVDDDSIRVRHYLTEFTESFIARGNSLHGQFSFVNEPGDFHFEIEWQEQGATKSFWIDFTVASTKMDVQSDYRAILKKVEDWDRKLIFSDKAKTLHEVATSTEFSATEATQWVVYFNKALDVYETAIKRIMHQPYRKMTKTPYRRRVDQVKKWSPMLARKYAQLRDDAERLERYRFVDEVYEMTFDTPENRFVKWTLGRITAMLKSAYPGIKDDEAYDADFRTGLGKRIDRFCRYARDAKLSRVGAFVGTPNTLVMQMRSGYVEIRKVWELMSHLFQTDLSLGGGRFAVGLTKLSALYEFWCFLAVKEIMDGIMKAKGVAECTPISVSAAAEALNAAGMDEDDTSITPIAYSYILPDGNKIADVAFQQSYGDNSEKTNGAFARPFQQRPDIVVRLCDKSQVYTYLFDAKYRIENSATTGYKDAAPRDALDQMHRYRDAILWRKTDAGSTDGVKREVVGAYILFPADSSASAKVAAYDYTTLIEEQNVGAFPMLPGRCDTLKCYLEKLVSKLDINSKTSSWLLSEKQVIPQKGLYYTDLAESAVGESETLHVEVSPDLDLAGIRVKSRFPVLKSVADTKDSVKRIVVKANGKQVCSLNGELVIGTSNPSSFFAEFGNEWVNKNIGQPFSTFRIT